MFARICTALVTLVFGLFTAAQAKEICQIDTGCPAPEVVPACTPAQLARPAAEALPAAGKTVVLSGTLKTDAYCTERGCMFETRCCNGCHGGAVLSLAAPVGGYTRIDLRDENPERFRVRGDESLTCQPLDAPSGTALRVMGTLNYARRVMMEAVYDKGKPVKTIERDLGVDTSRPYLDHVTICRADK